MDPSILLIVGIVIVLTLFFDFTNGFHDASSVVATVIACGAISPPRALILASVFTILGAILGGSAVVYTIQEELIFLPPGRQLALVLMAGIAGATVWNLITWRYGMPSSTTHALVGGLLGAALISAGPLSVGWGFGAFLEKFEFKGVFKVIIALLLSPTLGFGLAFSLQKLAKALLKNATRSINRWLKRIQLATAAILAYSHGANDTQKHMGIIMMALLSGSLISETEVPLWLRVLIGTIMMLGTLGGGWTIMRTLGQKIYRLEPIHSFNSQMASSIAVLVSTIGGGPISTTHVVGSSVMGAGAADEVRMVSWGVGKDMVISWLITIPVTAVISALLLITLRFTFSII